MRNKEPAEGELSSNKNSRRCYDTCVTKSRRSRADIPMPECHMCASPGNTDDHVPPKSFFHPKDRQGLARVPSCPKHNLDNSNDVEETTNHITLADGINKYGTTTAKTRTLASFLRKPKLFRRMYGGSKEAKIAGREVIISRVDLVTRPLLKQSIIVEAVTVYNLV